MARLAANHRPPKVHERLVTPGFWCNLLLRRPGPGQPTCRDDRRHVALALAASLRSFISSDSILRPTARAPN